jgi:hypothetical protein
MSDLKSAAKMGAYMRIVSQYNDIKQINILDLAQGYTEADRTTFRTFRDAVRTRCDEYEAQIDQGQSPVIDYSDIVP